MLYRGSLTIGAVPSFRKLLYQDADKLLGGQQHCAGFMARSKMLAFVKGAGVAFRAAVQEAACHRGDIAMSFAN